MAMQIERPASEDFGKVGLIKDAIRLYSHKWLLTLRDKTITLIIAQSCLRVFKLLASRYHGEVDRMTARGMKLMGFLLILVCATGCATMSDVVRSKERGEGTSKVYRVNANEAWEIAKAVFRWEETGDVEEHRSDGYMLTSSGESSISWGALMGVWIKPVSEDSTKVTVVIKRRNPTEVIITLTEAAFHDDFQLAVRLKAGKSLF